MKLLNEFVQLLDAKLQTQDVIKIRKEYYKVSPQLQEYMSISDKRAVHAGIFLGKEERKSFKASLALLELLNSTASQKAHVNPDGEWMFIVGRDVFETNITSYNKGVVLVNNQRDENIGLGKIFKGPNGVMLKPLVDKGDFLRRER